MAQVIQRPKKTREEERNRVLQSLETELLEECISVSRDTLRFKEIDPSTQTPPEDWVEELGEAGALERLRCAQAGWMNRKDAPVGVQIAMQLGIGILKSRSQKDKAPQTLNVQVVQVTAPLPQFPELELAEDER